MNAPPDAQSTMIKHTRKTTMSRAIILVMDSVQWKGELGTAMRRALNTEVPGLGRPEPLFLVRYIEPTLFNSVLNKTKNIILVATLDSKTKGGSVVRNFMTPNS